MDVLCVLTLPNILCSRRRYKNSFRWKHSEYLGRSILSRRALDPCALGNDPSWVSPALLQSIDDYRYSSMLSVRASRGLDAIDAYLIETISRVGESIEGSTKATWRSWYSRNELSILCLELSTIFCILPEAFARESRVSRALIVLTALWVLAESCFRVKRLAYISPFKTSRIFL